jgi:hypothetical protein
MPEYKCIPCNFSSDLRQNYLRHLRTPKHIKRLENTYGLSSESIKTAKSLPLEAHKGSQMAHKWLTKAHKVLLDDKKKNKNNGNDSLYKCPHCEKTFSKSSNVNRHMKLYCKDKIKEKEDRVFKEMVEKTILEQSKNIENLIELVGNTTQNGGNHGANNNVNSNNSNSNNTINNTININNFGSENLDMLTNKFMRAMVDRPYTAIPKMIKKIHFNDNYPENKNIRMLNKKDNKLQIIENGEWTYVDKEDTIDLLVGDKNFQLDEYYEKNKSYFTPRQNDRFIKFQDKIGESDKGVNVNSVKGTDLIFWKHM